MCFYYSQAFKNVDELLVSENIMVNTQSMGGNQAVPILLFKWKKKKNHEHVLLSFYEFFSTLEDKYVGVLSPDLQTSQAFWNNC